MLAQERDVVLAARVGGLANDRGVGGADHRDKQLRVDLTGAEVGMPVGPRPCSVARVIAVHQVDAAGKRLDAGDGVDQLFACGPGVAGVQAEPDAGIANAVPQPSR